MLHISEQFGLFWSGIVVGALIFLIVQVCMSLKSRRYDLDKIPCPPGTWLLGNLTEFSSPRAHRVMLDWAKTYGGIVRFRLAMKDFILLTDPSCLEAVTSLPRYSPVYQSVNRFCGAHSNFLTTQNEDEWRSVRKTLAVSFSQDNLRRTFPVLHAKLQLAHQWLSAPGPIDIQDLCNRIVLDYVGEAALDVQYDALKDKDPVVLKVIKASFEEANRQFTDPTRSLYVDWLTWTPDSKLARDIVSRSLKVYADTAAYIYGKPEPKPTDKHLWAQLKRLKHHATGEPLTESEMQSHMAVVVSAGFETTSHALGWALMEIATHPEVQAKLHAELKKYHLLHGAEEQKRDVMPSDLPSLKYLRAVLRESLRIHPTASFGTIRVTTKPTRLGPYDLPPDTPIWVNVYGFHNSSRNFRDADKFWPERWEAAPSSESVEDPQEGSSTAEPDLSVGAQYEDQRDATYTGNRHELKKSYIPFLDGRKHCIGQNLALFSASIILASLLSRFSFRLAPQAGSREEVLKGQIMALTLQSDKGIWLIARPHQEATIPGAGESIGTASFEKPTA